ncbi:hypothetical protein VN12_17140 [Pirellula sp. SH-Sr6A]|nr:hypothetical protein VN12_17140 [Pirellula sp. SH-Sr6A]
MEKEGNSRGLSLVARKLSGDRRTRKRELSRHFRLRALRLGTHPSSLIPICDSQIGADKSVSRQGAKARRDNEVESEGSLYRRSSLGFLISFVDILYRRAKLQFIAPINRRNEPHCHDASFRGSNGTFHQDVVVTSCHDFVKRFSLIEMKTEFGFSELFPWKELFGSRRK